MFGQLAKSESLRDLIVAFEVHWRKLYHLGMGKSVNRSNLAKANENVATESSKILPITCFQKHVLKAPKRYSVLMSRSMLFTQP